MFAVDRRTIKNTKSKTFVFRRSLSPLLINSFYCSEVDVYFIRFKWFHIVLYLCAVIFGDIIMQFVGGRCKTAHSYSIRDI